MSQTLSTFLSLSLSLSAFSPSLTLTQDCCIPNHGPGLIKLTSLATYLCKDPLRVTAHDFLEVWKTLQTLGKPKPVPLLGYPYQIQTRPTHLRGPCFLLRPLGFSTKPMDLFLSLSKFPS